MSQALGGRRAILDGEVVALLEDGKPSFELLEGRMGLTSEATVRRKAHEIPIVYMVFDVLYLDGFSVMGLPYTERRRLLEGLELSGAFWQTPGAHLGDGAALASVSRSQGLEGIIAKRIDSRYEPARRSGAWLKIKNQLRQEFVIGGWTPGRGARSKMGSLLVGYYDVSPQEAANTRVDQKLMYAGGVGTGFTEAMLSDLLRLLTPLQRESSPFSIGKPPKAHFVEPVLVAEVSFTEWTKAGILRQPSFKGMRVDKDARDVVRERI